MQMHLNYARGDPDSHILSPFSFCPQDVMQMGEWGRVSTPLAWIVSLWSMLAVIHRGPYAQATIVMGSVLVLTP